MNFFQRPSRDPTGTQMVLLVNITESSWPTVQGSFKTSLTGSFPCVWVSV